MVECNLCSREFETEHALAVHCGKKHNGKGNPKRVKIECKNCGKEFSIPLSIKDRRTFCSVSCKAEWRSKNLLGENHPSWKGGRPEKTCVVCGETYHTWHPENSRFCSVECKSKWRKNNWEGENNPNWNGGKEERICPNCEKIFYVYPLSVKKCCSNKCRKEYYVGEKHPKWKENYTEKYGSNWEEQRRKALERDEYTCQSCGVSYKANEKLENKLDVHHIVPLKEFAIDDIEKKANTLTNLITLCPSCHAKIEQGRGILETVKGVESSGVVATPQRIRVAP